jgi:lysozyme
MSSPTFFETMRQQLAAEEKLMLKPYVDCCGKSWRDCLCQHKGKLTIGIGRNIEDRGITQAEAYYLCDNDIEIMLAELDKAIPWYRKLDEVRIRVLIDMAFNMGVPRLVANNPSMLAACEAGDYARAATEMLNGPWHEQVKGRADKLAAMMRSGQV